MTEPADGAAPPDNIDPTGHDDIDPTGHDDIDPKVAQLVVQIRDRFGLRGLRGARWMVDQEIALAESALRELGTD